MAVAVEMTDDGTIIQVEETIETINERLPEYVAEELADVWQLIKAEAIELCPKDTGALASSIRLESEGGGGGIYKDFQPVQISGTGGGVGTDFYSDTIFAGDANIINPKSHEPTDLYALFVHDGHLMRDGTMYEGSFFLERAVAKYENEIDEAVDRALSELGVNSLE